MTRTILCVAGTRPEAIKMAPLILRLRQAAGIRLRVLATAQHRDMLDQMFAVFGIRPDIDLDLMRPDQDLTTLTGRMVTAVGEVLSRERPDAVLVQGDTTTVLATALAAFYARVPLGHVEAGLRTGDLDNPFPEEMNRVLTARIARWHFAPTEAAAAALRAEGTDPAAIHLTGNTGIDALLSMRGKGQLPAGLDAAGKLVLVTLHRRENFGTPLASILLALERLLAEAPDLSLAIPVHPNPNVRHAIEARFGTHPRVHLLPPQGYADFVALMDRATFVMTDSGGVQEEAPALGKPVLVLRETTERPEAVSAGVARIVGTGTAPILREALSLLTDRVAYAQMARNVSPYGDGRASERIVQVLLRDLAAEGAGRVAA
jgi:UDP-N-acetylglucosamine 2-epimerase (non-hydrolysing)